MALIVKVGGVIKSPLVDSLEIYFALNQQSACSMRFIVQDSWRPVAGAPVEVWDGTYLLYAGSIDEAEPVPVGPNAWEISIRCIDQTSIMHRRLAPERVWTNLPAGTIAAELGAAAFAGEGVEFDLVEPGPTVESFASNYETGAEAFAALGQAANMVSRISPSKQFLFHAPTSYPAPFQITSTPNDAKVRNLAIRSTREEYANRVLVRLGQAVEAGKQDTFNSTGRHGDSDDPEMALNGGRKLFDCSYRIYAAPTITINGVAQSVGILGQDTAVFYWQQGSQRLAMDDGATAPLATDTLVVSYTAVKENIIAVQNDDAIVERAGVEDGTGIHELSKTISEPVTIAEATAYAQALLDRYSQISYVATYETDTLIQPYAAGLEIGQYQQISRDGYNASGNYLIRSITIRDLKANGETHLLMTVEAVKGPVVGDAYEFFRRLSGARDWGAIGLPPQEGENPAIAPITGLSIQAFLGKYADLKIVLAGTADTSDPNYEFGKVVLWQPADNDPDKENPDITKGSFTVLGEHTAAQGTPTEWGAVIRYPYPDVKKIRWIFYVLSGNSRWTNPLVPLASLAPDLPANASPHLVVDLNLLTLPGEEDFAEEPIIYPDQAVIGINATEKTATISLPYRAPYSEPEPGVYSKGRLDGVEVFTMLGDMTDIRDHGKQPYTGGVGPTGDLGVAVATIPLPEVRPADIFMDLLSYIRKDGFVFEKGAFVDGVRTAVSYGSWAKLTIPEAGADVPIPTVVAEVADYEQLTPGGRTWKYRFKFTLSGAALAHPDYGGTKFDVEWASGSARLGVAEHKAGESPVVYSQFWEFEAPHSDVATVTGLAYRSDNPLIQAALASQQVTVGKDWSAVLPAIAAGSMNVAIQQYGYKDAQKWYEALASYTAPAGATIAYLYLCVKPAGTDPAFVPGAGDWKTGSSAWVPGQIQWWDTLPQNGARVFYAIVPKTEHWDAWPRAGVDPVKYFDLPAWAAPPAVSPVGLSVTAVNIGRIDGIPHLDIQYAWTDLSSDPNFATMRIQRIATDGAFAPLPGESYDKNGSWDERKPYTSGPHKMGETTQYWKYKFQAMSYDGRLSDPVYVNATFPPSGGVTADRILKSPALTTNGGALDVAIWGITGMHVGPGQIGQSHFDRLSANKVAFTQADIASAAILNAFIQDLSITQLKADGDLDTGSKFKVALFSYFFEIASGGLTSSGSFQHTGAFGVAGDVNLGSSLIVPYLSAAEFYWSFRDRGYAGAAPTLDYPDRWRNAMNLGDAALLDVAPAWGGSSSEVSPGDHYHYWDDVRSKPSTFPPSTHNHDDRYSQIGHTHYLDALDIVYNDNGQTNVGGALGNIFARLAAHGI